jgi:plasmid stabilization system protein ParE
MAKLNVTPIVWTEKSLENANSIRNYLLSNFSSNEVEHFYATLQSFELAVCAFPTLYPRLLLKKNIRRAVLSKVLSAYYRIHKGQIEVLALLDNRCDISKWL